MKRRSVFWYSPFVLSSSSSVRMPHHLRGFFLLVNSFFLPPGGEGGEEEEEGGMRSGVFLVVRVLCEGESRVHFYR